MKASSLKASTGASASVQRAETGGKTGESLLRSWCWRYCTQLGKKGLEEGQDANVERQAVVGTSQAGT